MLPKTRFVACTTAGEITERGLTHGGLSLMLIHGHDMTFDVTTAKSVSDSPRRAAESLCEGFHIQRERASRSGQSSATSLMLVDGVNGHGEELVDELFRATGSLHEVVGGAAGDEAAFQKTEVGFGEFSESDAAVCVRIFSEHRVGVGVDHGLNPVTEPMRVTKASGSTLYELDGKPAYEVYKQFAKSQNVELDPSTVGKFLVNNELGVYLFNEFKKARAPLKVGDSGELVCAAAVPQGSTVCILGGNPRSLVKAASHAAQEARHGLRGRPAAGVLLFDCICREAILDGSFDREIAAVREIFPNTPIAGFLTYGEIARYSGRLDGWHNATAVVAAIPA